MRIRYLAEPGARPSLIAGAVFMALGAWALVTPPAARAACPPTLAPTATVAAASGNKLHAVDVTGTDYAACPGSRPGPYFAVTWWEPSLDGDWHYADARWRLFTGLSSPSAIGGDRVVDASPFVWNPNLPTNRSGALWNRVSAAFEPGCSDSLNIGFAYWLRDYRDGQYNEGRRALQRQFFRCPSAAAAPGAGPSSEAVSAAPDAGSSPSPQVTCQDGACWADAPSLPADEPPLVFPAD